MVYNHYHEHRRTASMSDRKLASFRKKHAITLQDTPQGVEFKPITKFKRAGMPKALIKETCKDFERPSPIQAQCWPVLLSGHDGNYIGEQKISVSMANQSSLLTLAKQSDWHRQDGQRENHCLWFAWHCACGGSWEGFAQEAIHVGVGTHA